MENALSTAGMGASAFNDTHQAVKALVQAGIEERAAEAIVNYGQYRVQVSRQDIDRHYATKEEVKTLQMPENTSGISRQPRHQARCGIGQAGAAEGN